MTNFTMTQEHIDAINALLQIIATPEASKTRLDDLVGQTAKLKAAEQDLIRSQNLADIRDELAQRENMLSIRQAAVEDMEANQKAQREAINAVLRTPTA